MGGKSVLPNVFIWFNTSGCPTVRASTLIAHISLIPGPIIKPFDSMKVKASGFFLVYGKSSYWLYYPILGMKLFFDKVLPEMVSVCPQAPHKIKKNNALS